MKTSFRSLALATLVALSFSTAAMAQSTDPTDPGHPRVNEVDQRLENQQNRVNSGVANGTINSNQATRDNAKISREQNSLNADTAANNGHLTKADTKNLNKRENRGSRRIHRQKNTPPATTPSTGN